MKKCISLLFFVMALQAAQSQTIPDDPAFRHGKLANGMSYYLYHNENPAGVAEFYIAHNVGALQEEDSQNGLAHFLEHMAFNGTRHYPGKSLLEFLAKDGVRFGYNVNAYTSRTETVYNISGVPLSRNSFVDSVLTVLHDWSCDISCEQKALDDERGVISEEWRLRDEPRYRMMCRQNELIYRGGKQPERTVLGTMDVILGFKREDILDFYHKWYRPDLQAIIVVGDIDIDRMEARVREKFADIPMPANPPQKATSYRPPKQDGAMFLDMTDPTIKYKAYKIIFKQPYPALSAHRDEAFYRDLFSRNIVTAVLADRLRELSKAKDCPFQSAVFVTSEEQPWFYISLLTITARKDDEMASAVKAVTVEIERMLRYGISEEEFEVAKMATATKAHIDRELFAEDVKNSDVVRRCTESFLRDYPLVSPLRWQEIQRKALADIRYEDIKNYPKLMFAQSEKIFSTCYNVNEPRYAVSADTIKAIIAEVAVSELKPDYLDYPDLDLTVSATPGSIVSRKTLDHGIELWTLSNGGRVWYRQSAPVKSDNHLSMDICFDTGYRVFPQDKIAAGMFAANCFKRYTGFRGVDRLSIKSYPQLAGVSTIICNNPEKSYLQVSSNAEKIENAFRSANLQLTEPCFVTERHFERLKAEALKGLAKKKNQRDLHAEKEEKVIFGNNPWNVRVDSAAVNSLSYGMMKQLYKAAYGDFSGMKVYICSDAPKEKIEDYVCKYIASMKEEAPVAKAEAHPLWQAYKGRTEFYEEAKPLSAPMCEINYCFSAKVRKDTKMRDAVRILDHILSARYLDLIREERGGAYHIAFSTDVYEDPARPLQSFVSFQTRPELREILLKDVEDVMEDICKNGPTGKEVTEAVKFWTKYYGERKARIANSINAQLQQAEGFVCYGIDYDYDYAAVLASVTPSYIRKLARKISSGDRLVEVYTER